MRISSNPNDPGFNPEHYNYDVHLNGERVMFCLTADEELGTLTYFFLPLKIRLQHNTGDDVSDFVQKGVVRIIKRK